MASATKIKLALIWLKNNHPDYINIDIWHRSLALYPKNTGVVEGIRATEIDDEDFCSGATTSPMTEDIPHESVEANDNISRAASIVPNQTDEPLIDSQLQKLINNSVKGLSTNTQTKRDQQARPTLSQIPL